MPSGKQAATNIHHELLTENEKSFDMSYRSVEQASHILNLNLL